MQRTKQNQSVNISVVLAVYNEEKNIGRCLRAVSAFADEVILVDGSSTDKTVEEAKNLGAKVITTTNKPIFHINKQMAMDAAGGEIVLQLDADEVVDEELAKFILELKNTYKPDTYDTTSEPVAWWIRRKNLFLGRFLRKGGQYPDPVIRLYLAGFAKLPQKDVHEQMEVNGIIGTAAGHLIHYSNPTFADYLRKWNAYSSLSAKELHGLHKKLTASVIIQYILFKPVWTFLLLFVRHKGFVDGFAGFVFALMSGLFHQVVLLKAWELGQKREK